MRKTILLCAILLVVGSQLTVQAEEIVLGDLYAVMPLSDDKISWEDNGFNYIVARVDDNIVRVAFQKPVGNAQIIISRDNGRVVKQHDEIDPKQVVMDLNGTPAGRYLLEVYTDTEAVGGVFEVK